MKYSTPEMDQIWSLENKFTTWTFIEREACRAVAEVDGIIPKEDLDAILSAAPPTVERIEELEKDFKHDVIAFLHALMENVTPPSAGRYIHYGLTSSDVIDTAQSMFIADSLHLILRDCSRVISALRDKATLHKRDVCIGRTHGQWAEPTTIGNRFRVWMHEIIELSEALEHHIMPVNTYAKLSGAVGTHAHISVKAEDKFAEALNMAIDPCATQIISRHRISATVFSLVNLMSGFEKICQNIRLLQIPEIGELRESFAKKQRGSSAMPHKQNPILCERMCALARLVRGYLSPTIETNATWLERDLSNSALERITLSSIFSIVHYCVQKMGDIIEKLDVDVEASARNVEESKWYWASQSIMLNLVRKGLDKNTAYLDIQEKAMKGEPIDGILSSNELNAAIHPQKHIDGVISIFNSWGMKDEISDQKAV